MAAAILLEESWRFYYSYLGHKVTTNMLMPRREVTQVPLDNMISWWQAIFQISFRFLRNPGFQPGTCFLTSSLQQSKLYFRFLKKSNPSHPGKKMYHIWLPLLLKRNYKPGNTKQGFDHLCRWPFRRVQASWSSTLLPLPHTGFSIYITTSLCSVIV